MKSVGKLFVLSSLAIVTLFSCNNGDKGSTTKSSVPIFTLDPTGQASYSGVSVELKFFNDVGSSQIPYIKVMDYLGLFTNYYTCSNSGNTFTFKNSRWNNNNAVATFNASSNSLTYVDYASFVNANEIAKNPLDVVCGDAITSTFGVNFIYNSGSYTPGTSITVNLNNYNIKSKVANNNLYLPLYTTKTLFINGNWPSLFYNGNCLFEDVAYDTSAYYTNAVKTNIFTPNSGYLEYAYNQLGLDVDFKFGMANFTRNKRNGGTQNYKHYLGNSSLSSGGELSNRKSKFTSSVTGFINAQGDLLTKYLDDGGHTWIIDQYNYFNNGELEDFFGPENEYISKNFSILANKRKPEFGAETNAYKALKNGFYHDGNTIFVTFDQFNFEKYRIASAYGYSDDFPSTQEVLRKVNNEIRTSTSTNTITHLVLDLSQNGGGYVAAADMVCCYLTRGGSETSCHSSIGDAKGSVHYLVDLDGKNGFDENDKLPTQITSIDILCSKSTFSAANYTTCTIANYYKNSNETKVYIDGENSGGGQCCVDSTATNALGVSMSMSGYQKLYCDDKEVDSGVIGTGITLANSWELDPNDSGKNYSKYSDYSAIKTLVQSH